MTFTVLSPTAVPRAPLPTSAAALRIRPGERAEWVDADPWRSSWPNWRAEARARGLGVDGLISIWTEHRAALTDLEGDGVADADDALAAAAHHQLAQPRLAPRPLLQEWAATLGGARLGEDYPDELPELMLSARLLQWPTARRMLGLEITAPQVERAVECELAATLLGLTLQAWALEAALRHVNRSP